MATIGEPQQETYRGTGMTHLQGLIFDVDGTLADTEELHRQAFNAAFATHGLDWHWTPEDYAARLVISGGRERITHFAREVAPQLAARADFGTFARNLHRAKTVLYQEMLNAGQLRLRPGVERLLLEARAAQVALGIATSSAWANLKALLDNNLSADWQSWFAAIETCDTVEEKKPSPAVYCAVLRRLGLPAARCVAIEDTENGLRAARGAGLTTVVTTHRFTRDGNFDGAAVVLDGLGEPDHPMRIRGRSELSPAFVDLPFLDGLLAKRIDPASVTHWEQQRIAFG
jgi:HAD superfamily hydrolase (TIGR01509 family)